MSWFDSDEPIAVDLAECLCPGAPHDHDTVWLRAALGPDAGLAAMLVIRESNSDPEELEVRLGRVFLRFGIVRWTFVDDTGQVLPVNRDLIAKLPWSAVYPLANKASDLYSQDLLRPLVAAASKSSRNGHTARSTSVRRRSSSTPRKR